MNTFFKVSTLLATSLLFTACASTGSQPKGSTLKLANCAIQESIAGAKATGAFLTINKTGTQKLALVGAQAPSITSHVEVHEMVMQGGTMRMQQMPALALKEGANVLKKGGYHIMLMELKKPLKVGQTHQLTLSFSDGSSQSCMAQVKSVRALTPKGMKMMPHKHKKMQHKHK